MKSSRKPITIGIIWIIPIIIVARILEIFLFQQLGLYSSRKLVEACLGRQICQGRITALESLVEADDGLKELDLQKANLTGIDLANANLANVNLNHAILTGADLRKATLDRGQFEAAHLKGTNLVGAKLFRANLRGADLIVADLTNAELNNVDFTGAELYRAQLIAADLQNTIAIGSDLYRANFTGANLKNVDFRAGDLTGALLKDADLTGAEFRTLKVLSSLNSNGDSRDLPLSGIGFTVARGDNNYHVNVIYPATPAFKSGITRGDQIVKINGEEIESFNLNEIYSLLFDRPGTKITLTIRRSAIETNYDLVSEGLNLSVIGITPKQIKQAKNWDKANYDPQFRAELGLPNSKE